MARRNSSQVRGAVAEATVLAQLLECGAAVNSLTMDDSGWDLHLHLPTEPMAGARSRKVKDDWELGGHTVHVQVKARQALSNITVSGSTVRGWVSGSAVGTPTFLIVVPSLDSDAFETQYLDPLDISKYANDVDDSILLPITGRNRFYPSSFGFEADIWAHHGPAMFRLDATARNFVRPGNGSDYTKDLTAVATLVGAAALTIRQEDPTDDGREMMGALEDISETLVAGLDHEGHFDDRLTEELRSGIHESAQTHGDSWSDPQVPLAVISPHRDWSAFRADLDTFATRLGATRRAYVEAREEAWARAIAMRAASTSR